MQQNLHDLPGTIVAPDQLRLPRAKGVVTLLQAKGSELFTQLQECRAVDSSAEPPGVSYSEIVIFETEPEIPQSPMYGIKKRERLAVIFSEDDDQLPVILSLRKDFCRDAPHLNLGKRDDPASLCWTDAPWHEEKHRWSALRFIQRLRQWLALTSEGKLHQDDQPLEPLILGAQGTLILPAGAYENPQQGAEPLFCYLTTEQGQRPILIAESAQRAGDQPVRYVAIRLGSTTPVTHGVIRWAPQNLHELHELVAPHGLDLITKISKHIKSWSGNKELLQREPIFLIQAPKKRTEDGEIEAIDPWAFLAVGRSLGEIGESLGVIERTHTGYGQILFTAPDISKASGIPLALLQPYTYLHRQMSQACNGIADTSGTTAEIVAIGAGALGSQVILNLARSGFGKWVIVDDDALLPHNLARHALVGGVGYTKSVLISMVGNELLQTSDFARPIAANILAPSSSPELEQALNQSSLVLDMSASIPVARHLARDRKDVAARRASLYLSPSGHDLVLLAEDASREFKLDALEMQYYRALITCEELAGHLSQPAGRVRYGRTCRDLSLVLSQEDVALHSAIGARAVRTVASHPDRAFIRIWRTSEDMQVKTVDIPISPTIELDIPSAGWKLCTDEHVMNKVRAIRATKFPNETGGVLIGTVDSERKIVYVVDCLTSPKDSIETPGSYVRGTDGLEDCIQYVRQVTGGEVDYIGEWHSHPKGYSPRPSSDDRVLFEWIEGYVSAEGHPSVMLIVGEGEGWHVDEMLPDA
jgi:integrative and conjugative element protein (TIGR02256 family)